jgi:hypothetical protein
VQDKSELTIMKPIFPLIVILFGFGVTACTPAPIRYEQCRLLACFTNVESLGGDHYRVSAEGNSSNSLLQVEQFAMLKAAEHTLQTGRSHFRIEDANQKDTVQCLQFSSACRTLFRKVELQIQIGDADAVAGATEASKWLPAQEVYDKLAPGNVRS